MANEENSTEQGSVAAGAKTEVRKAVGNITGLLAIVGACAALVQIWEAFNKNEPALSAELHTSASFIPDGSRIALTIEESSIWQLSKNDSVRHYCSARVEGSTNYYRDDDNCRKIKSIVEKVDRSADFGEASVSRSEIDVKNSGSDVASGLKLRVPNKGHVLVVDQADKSVVDKDVAPGDAFSLPNLNPSESLKITIDTSVPSFDTLSSRELPILTYSRGAVSISQYRIVSPFFGSVADALEGIPRIILAMLFVAVCFLVTASVIIIAGVANALLKGKSIASVFQNGTI